MPIIDALIGEWETLLLLSACVGLFMYLKAEKPSWHALALIGCYTLALILMSLWGFFDGSTDEKLHKLYEIWGTGNHAAAVIYVGALLAFIIWPPKPRDTLVHLIAVVVVFAEVWTGLMENVNCNFLQTDIPFDLRTPEQKEMSVCERIYGWWYRYIPLIGQIALMLYFVKTWRWARRLTAS